MTDEELIARLRVDGPVCEEHFTANLAADRIEALVKGLDDAIIKRAAWELEAKVQQARAENAEAERDEAVAKVDFYEQKDGMGGAVVYAIRELLNAQGVPLAAFIDDHVANAIRQWKVSEARAEQLAATNERLEAALRETTQVLRQCTFPYIRVKGQYLDREEVVSRADAALKGADHE